MPTQMVERRKDEQAGSRTDRLKEMRTDNRTGREIGIIDRLKDRQNDN